MLPSDAEKPKAALTHPNGARNAIWYCRTPIIRPVNFYAPHYDGVGNYIEQPQNNDTAPHVDPQPTVRNDYKKLRNSNKNCTRQQKHRREKREISIDIPLPIGAPIAFAPYTFPIHHFRVILYWADQHIAATMWSNYRGGPWFLKRRPLRRATRWMGRYGNRRREATRRNSRIWIEPPAKSIYRFPLSNELPIFISLDVFRSERWRRIVNP